MKKHFARVMVFAISFMLFGCSAQPGGQNQPGQTQSPGGPTLEEIAANPFTMKYDDTDAQVKNMAGNDTFGTLTQAGPLYVGKEVEQQPGLKKFRELKLALVGEIMQAVAKADTDGRAYAADLKKLKDVYIGYLGRTLEQNKKLGKQMKELSKEIIASEVAYTANFALYKSTDLPAIDIDSAKAFFQYQQVYLTLQNVSLLTDDTAQTVGGLMNLQSALLASGDANMKIIADDIEKDVPALVDSLGKKMVALQQSAVDVDVMLKRIDTAEYYMGQASVQYMQTELTGLNSKLDGLQPSESVTADDIVFMKNLTKYYGDFAGEIKQQLDQVDKTRILSFVEPEPGFVPAAVAQVVPESGYGWKALGMLTSAAESTYNAGKTAGEFTWNAGKTLVGAAKTTAGVTLDTLAATAQSAKDVIGGAVGGDSLGDITKNVKDNFGQVASNYHEGRSGSDVLTTAHEYFEGAEKVGGNLAEGAVEKTLGKGWTSWMAGHVGKLSVNLFTSLGKGITAVANKSSTNGEILEGALDIGMSFVGGSKVIASGSQMAKGSKELLKNFGEQGFNFLAKTLWASEAAAAKALREEMKVAGKMTAKELEQALYMNASDVAFKEGMVKEMKAAGKKLTEELKGLIGQGAETVAENATVGLEKSFNDFVKEEFAKSLKGVGDAIIATLGDDLTKYFDNIVANKIDDIIKELTKEAVDSGKIPGLVVIPDIKDLAGRWDNGSMVITDVIATEEFKKKAKAEGCDFSAVEQQKGKPVPLELLMQPTSATGGNLTIKGSDGKPQSIPFTYVDGVISAQYSEQGANISMNMNVSQEDGQIKTTGPMEINYGDGGLKIMATTEASKTAPGEPAPSKPVPPPKAPVAPAPGAPTTPGGQTPTNPAPAANDFANT